MCVSTARVQKCENDFWRGWQRDRKQPPARCILMRICPFSLLWKFKGKAYQKIGCWGFFLVCLFVCFQNPPTSGDKNLRVQRENNAPNASSGASTRSPGCSLQLSCLGHFNHYPDNFSVINK